MNTLEAQAPAKPTASINDRTKFLHVETSHALQKLPSSTDSDLNNLYAIATNTDMETGEVTEIKILF